MQTTRDNGKFIISFDFNGLFKNTSYEIIEFNSFILEIFKKAGATIWITSGNDEKEMKPIFKKLNLDSYIDRYINKIELTGEEKSDIHFHFEDSDFGKVFAKHGTYVLRKL